MNHIYIHCPHLPDEQYRLVLDRLCPETVRNITVYTQFAPDVAPEQIEAMVQVQKDFAQHKPIRFQNHAVFAQLPRFRKALRKVLIKNNFIVELQVQKEQAPQLVKIVQRLEKSAIIHRICLDERQDQEGAYRLFATQGLHLCFDNPIYTAQTPELFDKWLYDPAARGVNTFTDIIHMLTLQSRSPNCRHASCFGSVFRVDEALNVYLCPYCVDDRTRLGSLQQADSLNELLNCQAVADLLPDVVQKRQHCSESCAGFAHCQGGCPLEALSADECRHYTATVDRIRQRLLEVYREGKLAQVNYIVKNAILNALAFGTAFFN